MQKLHKKEDTWRETLGHCDAGFDSTLRVFKGWWYGRCLAQSDGNPNVLSANRNDDGRWLNANYDRPDDNWNDNGGFAFVFSQLSSFLSRLCGRVLFCELPVPAAEHFACFIQYYRQGDVLLGVERFCFPENHEKYA